VFPQPQARDVVVDLAAVVAVVLVAAAEGDVEKDEPHHAQRRILKANIPK
jgi:hypothetical protein